MLGTIASEKGVWLSESLPADMLAPSEGPPQSALERNSEPGPSGASGGTGDDNASLSDVSRHSNPKP